MANRLVGEHAGQVVADQQPGDLEAEQRDDRGGRVAEPVPAQ